MRTLLNKIGKFFFDLFSKVKIANLSELVIELVKALQDGKITEEERQILIKKAQSLLSDIEEKDKVKEIESNQE